MASPSPLILVPESGPFSGRARSALSEINRAAANPKLGASVEEIKEMIREVKNVQNQKDKPDARDLVALLIQDNQDLWNKLLNNSFCAKMKQAAADDQEVLKGFKWYMVQDFLYCVRNMTYETDRASTTTNSTDFDTSAERVAKSSGYAQDMLKTCMSPEPKGLDIADSSVLKAEPTEALTSYTDYQINTAETSSWVLGYVAMIPCIMSYYDIAVDLKDNSVHKDTIWYTLWALENAQYEDSTIRMKAFFKTNYNAWKDCYNDAQTIFRRACQGEIDLWEVGNNPQNV